MIFPTIHLNGTSPEMLRDGYTAARQAVGDAIRAMEKIEFNARDYYPQGPDAWRQADGEMRLRYTHLSFVITDLEKLEMHCQDAIDARGAQKT
jgi:hypothetical protein